MLLGPEATTATDFQYPPVLIFALFFWSPQGEVFFRRDDSVSCQGSSLLQLGSPLYHCPLLLGCYEVMPSVCMNCFRTEIMIYLKEWGDTFI